MCTKEYEVAVYQCDVYTLCAHIQKIHNIYEMMCTEKIRPSALILMVEMFIH